MMRSLGLRFGSSKDPRARSLVLMDRPSFSNALCLGAVDHPFERASVESLSLEKHPSLSFQLALGFAL